MKEPYGDDSPSSSVSAASLGVADLEVVPVDTTSPRGCADETAEVEQKAKLHTTRQQKQTKLERSRSTMVSPFSGQTPDCGGSRIPSLMPSSTTSCEFATPSRRLVRPNSPVVITGNLISTASGGVLRPMAVPARGRIAIIRRESDCTEQKTRETEAAHERLVKASQQVSLGFEDFCLDEKLFDERKRAKSLTEPISILTSAFLIPPTSCSPSPTRSGSIAVDSSQKVVRGNLSYYSPSPSPTPSTPNSPNRNRIMRSMSPIAIRQISKRRHTGSPSGRWHTGSGNNSGRESDGESSLGGYPLPQKRQCHQLLSSSSSGVQRSAAASPLIRDPLSANSRLCSSPVIVMDPTALLHQSLPVTSSSMNSNIMNNDNNSSTTFSSRAESPNTAVEGEEESEMELSGERLKELETTGEGGSGLSLSLSSVERESSFNSDG